MGLGEERRETNRNILGGGRAKAKCCDRRRNGREEREKGK